MQRIAVTVCLLAFAVQPALAGSTINVETQGVSVLDMKNFDLGDGHTSQSFEARFVSTGTGGDFAGQTQSGECYGSAEITAESYADTMLCVTRTTDTDSFVTRMKFNSDGWDWEVVGGTGKFVGATGSGHVLAGFGDTKYGDRGAWTNKGTITIK